MAATNINAINFFSPAKIVVSKVMGEGTHTTIANALSAASAGDTIVIMPGTYTENPALVAGVNLVAFSSDSGLNALSNTSANVVIQGKCTFSSAGTVTIAGIQLETNSDYFLAVTGSSASIVNLVGCFLNASNNTGINFTSSSGSSELNISYCMGDVGTTSIAPFTCTASGSLSIYYTTWANSGSSTTQISITTTTFNFWYSFFNSPMSITTASGTISYSWFVTQASTGITTVTSGTTTLTHCVINSSSAAAVSAGSSTTVGMNLCEVSSSKSSGVLTGSGTINTIGVLFTGSGKNCNVTTNSGGVATGLSQGTAPSSGFIGEQIESVIAQASAVSLSNTVAKNITSINLTAGIWDVSCLLNSAAQTCTGTQFLGGISTTTGTLGTFGDSVSAGPTTSATTAVNLTVPAWRITLSSTTTVYLVAQANFTAGTHTTFGRLSATRVG